MLPLAPLTAHAVSAPSPLVLERNPSWLPRNALALDSEATTAFDLAALWGKLASRHVRHVRSFFTERDCHSLFELAPEPESFGSPLREADLRILETVAFGGTQKQIAIGLGQSASTVSIRLRRALIAMGFHGVGAKAPLIVVVAAYASRCPESSAPARAQHLDFAGKRCLLVSAGRPDRQLKDPLSETEATVVRLLVEGLKHHEIARRRGTSFRTVANQISTAFKTLHVSGRSQLISHLVEKRANLVLPA